MTLTTSKRTGGHPTAERAAEIKTSVVAATLKAFADKGIDFGMDEVARLAGVSKQAIYRRWRSKTDLVVDAIDTVLTEGIKRAESRDGDVVEAFHRLAWRVFGDDQVASNRLAVFLQVESFRDARLRERLIGWRERLLDLYRRSLLDVEAAGRRAPGDVDVQAELLMDLLSGASSKLALTGEVSLADRRACFEQRWAAFRTIAIR